MTKASLGSSSTSTEGNLVRTLQASFDGFMPPLSGQRKYGGVYTMPTITGDISASVKTSLTWLSSYGLWGDEAFEENKNVDEAFIDTMLQRFYMYFGTEKKDDFFAYTNHDFLYQDPTDQNITPEDDYRRILLLNGEEVKSNVIKYTKGLINGGDDDASFYQEALDYYEGTLDYSFLKDPSLISLMDSIKNISSLSDWTTYSANLLSSFGQSSLAAGFSFSVQIDETGKRGATYGSFTPSSETSYLNGDSFPTDSLIKEATEAYEKLGIENASSLANSFSSFASRHRTLYLSDSYQAIKYKQYALYDLDTKKDLLATHEMAIDLSSLFTRGGYSLAEMALCKTGDGASYLSYAKTLEEATLDELRSVAYFELYGASKDALSYTKGTPGTYEGFLTLIQNNLALDYMASDYYAPSLQTLTDLFSDIQRIFAKRLDSSSWLSSVGKEAVKEKLSAVKSTLIGTSSDGSVLSYADIVTKKCSSLGLDFGSAKAQSALGLVKCLENGKMTIEKYSLITFGPFLANAFYLQGNNSINISFGAVFSLGIDLSSCSKETILAKVGYVLGHEVTHGFDGDGVYFDKDGNYPGTSIIPAADQKKFEDFNLKAEKIYEGKEVLPGLSQNPHTTITEDVADMGGFAFMEDLGKETEGFDFALFYEELASGFASKVTRRRFIDKSLNDVHPYARVRCNVLLSNSSKFQETFSLKEGEGMYRSKSEQVIVW